jgi:alanyl-tRNA synthetase
VSESSISAGTRRIEAVAGVAAAQWYEQRSLSVTKLSRALSCAPDSVVDRVEALIQSGRAADARTLQLEAIAAMARLSQRPRHSWSIGLDKLVFILAQADDAELLGNKAMKTAVEAIRAQENANVVMLLPSGVVMVSAVEKSSANELLACILQPETVSASSKRSGSPPFAQGKIKDSAWSKLLCDCPHELARKLNFISK